CSTSVVVDGLEIGSVTALPGEAMKFVFGSVAAHVAVSKGTIRLSRPVLFVNTTVDVVGASVPPLSIVIFQPCSASFVAAPMSNDVREGVACLAAKTSLMALLNGRISAVAALPGVIAPLHSEPLSGGTLMTLTSSALLA